jgi:hypothetical protein
MAITVRRLTLSILVFMLFKAAMITIKYNNTSVNLGTALWGETFYEADF